MLLVKLHRVQVFGRHRIGRDSGVGPEGTSRQQPYRAVVGRRIGLRDEGRAGAAVELAALGEAFHRFVVLEHGIAPRRGKAPARDLERQVAKPAGLLLALVRQLDDARDGVQLDREVHGPAVLMGEQLARAGQDE